MVGHSSTCYHKVACTRPLQHSGKWYIGTLLLQVSIWCLVYAHIAHRHSHSKRDTMVHRHRITLTRHRRRNIRVKTKINLRGVKKPKFLCIWLCQIEPTFYQISFCNSVFEEPIYLEKVSIIFFCWWLRNASLCIYPRLSELPDNFDRIRLEFVGFKKVVFVVVRFLGSGEEVSNPLA